MIFQPSRTTAPASKLRFGAYGRVSSGIAALMLTASAVAMMSGTARAACDFPSDASETITCDAGGGGGFGVNALGGDDTVNITGGTYTDSITGGNGADTITLSGGTVNGGIAGQGNSDVINLLSGMVADVLGDGPDMGGMEEEEPFIPEPPAADTIILNGAVVTGTIHGNEGNDLIILMSGSALTVTGNEDNDTITLSGASITGYIDGDIGDDSINLLSGSAGEAVGDLGNDTITLNGALIGGMISGNDGDDLIELLSGTAAGSADGGAGNDTITLAGASIGGNIFGAAGDDLIDLASGTVSGFIGAFGGGGADTITLSGATVDSLILGGAEDDRIIVLGGSVNGVQGDTGNDDISVGGGTVINDVLGNDGDDTITLNGGSVGGKIKGDGGADQIFLLSGTALHAEGNNGADSILLAGATITGDILGQGLGDIIVLSSGSVSGDVFGDGPDIIDGVADPAGGDVIVLSGAAIAGDINGGDVGDLIQLISGSVTNVNGENGGDFIQLAGAAVSGNVDGGADADTVDLLSGTVGNDVLGGTGNDTITLDGASVGGNVRGDDGDDVILLLSGIAAANVSGNEGNDTITLAGATVGIDIFGAGGNDVIDLQSGSAGGAFGGGGNDTISLNGASISGNIFGNGGDDVFALNTGSFGGNLEGGTGIDTATIAATFNLATIGGLLDGGEGINAVVDTLNINASGSLFGPNVIGWEIINVNNATLAFTGAGLTTSAVNGQGLFLNNSLVDFNSNAFALVGDVTIDGTSTLQADTPGGIGVFSVSGDLINMNLIDLSDGSLFGAGDTLTIGDDYTSFSELHLDVALDSTEAGDSLVIIDDILGAPTEITFTDVAAANPPSFTGTGPGNGIVVVDNSTGGHIVDTDFVFDPVAHPTNEILKVPFVYTLNLENDDILYLQSDVLPQIYGYAILSELMREEFPILRDRLGDRRFNGIGDPEPSLADTDNAGIWARIHGRERWIAHDGGYNTGEWEESRGEAEIGIDIPMQAGGGVGVFGVSVHAVRGYADANSGVTPDPSVTEVDTTGFGAGLSFAWFPGRGFYADVQGRLTAWDADVENVDRDIDQDVNGLGWGASLEVGNRLQFGSNAAIIPRGQVVYTDVDFDNFTDDDGVEVSQDDSASVVISGGVTVEQMFEENGVAIFADASVNHDVLKDSSIDASGFTFKSGLDKTWGKVQFGAAMETGGGTSAYIAVDASSSIGNNFGDSVGYGLKAGFRLDF